MPKVCKLSLLSPSGLPVGILVLMTYSDRKVVVIVVLVEVITKAEVVAMITIPH